MSVSLNNFEKEIECTYRGEHYSVRDNGAVRRHARKGKRVRPLDDKWTLGKQIGKRAYLGIAGVPVHRIVATAFYGPSPTKKHVVDHIDTNRRNNRPENLRWLTRLENTLSNPITRKRIEFHCGSIEAFLEDPSILKNSVDKDPNFDWMRTVTPEEAQISWEKLSKWATKENNNTSSKNNSLGDWVFNDNLDHTSSQKESEITSSPTPNAVQKDWKTPSEFPFCPKESANNSIAVYTSNLKLGEAFSINQYSISIIIDFAQSKDENTLWVMCKNSNDNAIKPWTLAEITFENDLFVHKNLGSFFKEKGAQKQFTLVQGLEWTGGDTFDDFC